MRSGSPLTCLCPYSKPKLTLLAMAMLSTSPRGIPKSALAPAPKTKSVLSFSNSNPPEHLVGGNTARQQVPTLPRYGAAG